MESLDSGILGRLNTCPTCTSDQPKSCGLGVDREGAGGPPFRWAPIASQGHRLMLLLGDDDVSEGVGGEGVRRGVVVDDDEAFEEPLERQLDPPMGFETVA
jgi:hypothetical protein